MAGRFSNKRKKTPGGAQAEKPEKPEDVKPDERLLAAIARLDAVSPTEPPESGEVPIPNEPAPIEDAPAPEKTASPKSGGSGEFRLH